MATYKVTCITPDGADNDHAIDGLGGIGPDNIRWNDTKDNVWNFVTTGQHSFYTEVNNRRASVLAKVNNYGTRYLTTSPDGYSGNNLLGLPGCR
jgi:Protein of unknown function (DUF3892)